MPFVPHPGPSHDAALDRVALALDPILVPLGFAAGQVGATGEHGQVVFCRGVAGSVDGGCIDLVIDLAAAPEWHITDVRYSGFTSDRRHLAFDRSGDLTEQLVGLRRTLAADLA